MAQLLYGSGLRLMECVRLRVKDLDFGHQHIIVRDGKGYKDRATMLPGKLVPTLQAHLEIVKAIHKKDDLFEGFGSVYLPDASNENIPMPVVNGFGNSSSLPTTTQKTLALT